MRGHAKAVLLAAGSYTGISALGYVVLVYYVSYATGVLRLPLPTVLTLLLMAAALFAVAGVMFARWSDRIGRRRVMLWGNGALVVWRCSASTSRGHTRCFMPLFPSCARAAGAGS